VLDEALRAGVDRLVIGGDVLPGPMPRECLDRLRALKIPVECIRGNGDREVLSLRRGADAASIPAAYRDVTLWNAAQLGAPDEAWLGSWPATLTLDVDGIGRVLFCHATPRSDTEIFTRLTPESRLAPIFEGVDAAVVVCGHTHMPFDRRVGAVRVVNAGSVGMPFGAPGADWLIIGAGIEARHTAYDLAAAAARIRATAYPGAREFAERSVLRPPTEKEALAAFSSASL
jgi:predicted phosphodiesterase